MFVCFFPTHSFLLEKILIQNTQFILNGLRLFYAWFMLILFGSMIEALAFYFTTCG